MKHDELRSVAHNVAHSLAGGIGLLIGVYTTDVFGEASSSPEGRLTVDFLNGTATEGSVSESLAAAFIRYKEILPALCDKHGGSIADFREFKVIFFGGDRSGAFSVIIEDKNGRRSSTDYEGHPGHRVKVLDALGRVRKKPVRK